MRPAPEIHSWRELLRLLGLVQISLLAGCTSHRSVVLSEPLIAQPVSNRQSPTPLPVAAIPLTAVSPTPVPTQLAPFCTEFKNLEYFGFYNYYWANADTATHAFDEYSGFSNLAFIHHQADTIDAAKKVVSTHPIASVLSRLDEARALKLKVILDGTHSVFFSGTYPPKLLPDYKDRWNEFKKAYAGYIDDHSLVLGFYFEEPYWDSTYLAADAADVRRRLVEMNGWLSLAASLIKADYPDSKIILADIPYAGAAFSDLKGNEATAIPTQCPECAGAISIPSQIDWIGLEGLYPTQLTGHQEFPACSWDYCFGHSMPEHVEVLKKLLTSAGQRLFLVPPAYLSASAINSTSATLRNDVNQAFVALAEKEPSIVALLPYHWQNAPVEGSWPDVGISTNASKPNSYSSLLIKPFTAVSSCVKYGIQFDGPPNIRTSDGSIYHLTSKGKACAYTSLTSYVLAGGLSDLSRVPLFQPFPSNIQIEGPCSMTIGYFRTSKGTFYYFNGAGHSCSFANQEQMIHAGGPADLTRLPIFDLFPADVKNDGACGG